MDTLVELLNCTANDPRETDFIRGLCREAAAALTQRVVDDAMVERAMLAFSSELEATYAERTRAALEAALGIGKE